MLLELWGGSRLFFGRRVGAYSLDVRICMCVRVIYILPLFFEAFHFNLVDPIFSTLLDAINVNRSYLLSENP